ncbi:hypothetical protein [Craterilacuibacter sinensis]|uniref:Uncharacterized protein n=1 Tax=Craterilacuibacter sinensis TaxID=2686017 RepID=A0A845BKD8_9NEIS|nr:hypothetical protein [Craterilacuibacter sinensis]MXR36732.1 hypothetical protein [Craterilacuibacter sinensis]
MQTTNQEFIDFIKNLQEWHGGQVTQLELVVEEKTADLKLGEALISADSDIAKGIRLGVSIALSRLGKLPFNVTPCVVEAYMEEE